jgi:hypothetical protein
MSGSKTSWFVVAGSSIGKSHIADGTTCQDSFYHEALDADRGLAIICDGAGSAKNSALGAAHVARECAPEIFKAYGADKKPTDWPAFCLQAFEKIARSLNELAIAQNIPYNSLACTAIILLYSPTGILVTHVGDGRAGYRNEQGDWKPLLSPHKGEEANQTVFVTSLDWTKTPITMSGVSVPECRVIADSITAFTLLSDGCENHSFLCSVMDQQQQRWHDPNEPYPGFFEPLLTGLAAMKPEQANEEWPRFLKNGTPGLENEPDDKTMILGTLN